MSPWNELKINHGCSSRQEEANKENSEDTAVCHVGEKTELADGILFCSQLRSMRYQDKGKRGDHSIGGLTNMNREEMLASGCGQLHLVMLSRGKKVLERRRKDNTGFSG